MTDDVPTDIKDIWHPKYADYLEHLGRRNGALRNIELEHFEELTSFEYVLLETKYDWTGVAKEPFVLGGKITRNVNLLPLIEIAIKEGMTAFFSNKMAFLFPDNVPEEFRTPVLIHEFEEKSFVDSSGVVQGSINDIAYAMSEDGCSEEEVQNFLESEMEFAQKFPHVEGCISELSYVFEQGESYSKKFSNWLIKTNKDINNPSTFFNQAIDCYLGKKDRLKRDPLEVVIEFYFDIEPTTPEFKKNLIDEKPWMSSYIKLDKEE